MAERIPDPLKRRHLLEEDVDPKKARAVAEAYLAEGRAQEAIAFLARAEDRDALAEISAQAVREGDVFLLREARLALGSEADARTWRELAGNASAAGLERYASEALRQAERLEDPVRG